MNKIYEDLKTFGLGVFFAILAMALLQRIFGRVCLLSIIAGVPCPACGMTRAFFLLLSGRILESINMHPLLPFVIVGFVIIPTYRYVKKKPFPYAKICVIMFFVIMVLVYGYRMYYYFPNRAPLEYNKYNVIYGIRLLLESISAGK